MLAWCKHAIQTPYVYMPKSRPASWVEQTCGNMSLTIAYAVFCGIGQEIRVVSRFPTYGIKHPVASGFE